MRTSKWNAAVLMLVIGWAAQAGAAENKSSLAPLTHAENKSNLAPLTPLTTLTPQAAAPTTPPPDYILKSCEETVSGVNAVIDARSFSPAATLAEYLGNKNNRNILGNSAAFASIKTTLLEDTKHGKITSIIGNVGSYAGMTYYVYTAIPNYEGKDKAIFMAEFEGKLYKIVLELHVFAIAPAENQSVYSCPPPQLIKVNGKPVSGSSSYDLNAIPVTFADLQGAAVGQTTGNSITLDTNAAGYNWFIDTTPADHSEFLPTSNPNEWVAKAGSAATHTWRRSV